MADAQPLPLSPLDPQGEDTSAQGVSPARLPAGETPPTSASQPTSESVGALALMRAVLVDAIECLSGQGIKPSHRARVAMQARAWIARRGCDSLFSFDSICDALELDGERLRRILLSTPPTRRSLQQLCSVEELGLTVNVA